MKTLLCSITRSPQRGSLSLGDMDRLKNVETRPFGIGEPPRSHRYSYRLGSHHRCVVGIRYEMPFINGLIVDVRPFCSCHRVEEICREFST